MEQQEKLINIILKGTLTAVTGLASTSDGMRKDGKVKYQALPRMAGRPIIRSTGIGGGLRRALSDEIVRSMRQHDHYPYDNLFSWLLNRQGGIASFGVPLKFGEMTEMRKKNPALSLFGAGNIPSKIAIEAAVPEDGEKNIVARDRGFRTDDLRRNSALAADLPPHFLDEYVLLRFGAQGSEAAIASFDALKSGDLRNSPIFDKAYASLNGEEAVDSSVVEDEGDDEGEDKDAQHRAEDKKRFTSIVNPYGGFEYFIPGTKFHHKITLLGLTRDEAAMAVGALYAFARRPVLGGHLKNGMGHVSCSYRVTTFDDDPLAIPVADGDVTIASRTDHPDNPRPAFASTSPLVNDLLKRFLDLCANGFEGYDFNVGVSSEMAGLENAADDAKKALENAAKAKRAKNKKKEQD